MRQKHIKILGITYDIKFVDQVDKFQRAVGQIDYTDQTITLEKGLKKDITGQALFHEIMHGVFEGLGYADVRDDEKMVQSISATLHQVLVDNWETIFSLLI